MSVTTVPILPVGKGTLVKLWGGVAIAAIIAGGLAWAGTSRFVSSGCGGVDFASGAGISDPVKSSTGLQIQTTKVGSGAKPSDADVVLVNYKGRLTDGTEFDAGQRVPFPVQGLVPGFSEALKSMQRGGSYTICIPSDLGYGDQATGKIPPNSTLVFDVDLLDFRSMAEIQAMQAQMQQQQGGAGAPPPGEAPHGSMPAQ